MNQTMTAAEAIERIHTHRAEPETRTLRRIEIGQRVHQGDVYLTRVQDAHPRGARLGTNQVAVGTNVGSRHVAEGAGVEVFVGQAYPPDFSEPQGVQPNSLLGPVVVSPAAFTLTHPEHAHHKLPAGCYQVTYQADLATNRAVVD